MTDRERLLELMKEPFRVRLFHLLNGPGQLWTWVCQKVCGVRTLLWVEIKDGQTD